MTLKPLVDILTVDVSSEMVEPEESLAVIVLVPVTQTPAICGVATARV